MEKQEQSMLWQWTQLIFLQYKGLCQCICGCIFASYSDLGLGVQVSPRPHNKVYFCPTLPLGSFHNWPGRWPTVVGLGLAIVKGPVFHLRVLVVWPPKCLFGAQGMQAALLHLGSSRTNSWCSWAEKWAWTPELGCSGKQEHGQP